MIEPIKITFDTDAATDALNRLAKAALERPDLVNGISQLAGRLFESNVEYGSFAKPEHEVTIQIYPSEMFKAFLKGIRIADGDRREIVQTPAPVAPPFDDLQT